MHPMILEELRRRKVSGGGGVVYATWNPADKGANILLSNEEMTAEKVTSTWTNAAVRSTIVKNSGIHSAELYINSTFSRSTIFGIATPTTSLTNIYAGEIFGYYGANGTKYIFGSNSAYGTFYHTGNYAGLKVDFDAGTIQFYKNGVGQPLITDARISSNNFHLVTGSYYATTATLNTGATPFQYPILPTDGWFV